MGLQPITMMLMLNNIKVLHLEPTTDCNAACPQCKRTYNTFESAELTLSRITELFSVEFIKQLDKMFMCGNLGDPAAAKDTIEIFKYFRSINPAIILGMNTNGGIRTTKWWADLASVLNNPKDYVVFSIDGLEDTNHIYRRNVVWSRVIENAASFIKHGGQAHWDMLVFAHNEHQVDLVEQIAASMDFKWFRAKISKRHKVAPIPWLSAPVKWQDPNVTLGTIDCYALKEKSIYVDAQGTFYPCCWLGNTSNTLEQFDEIKLNWNTNKQNTICAATCSKINVGTSFTNQWQREVEF
jgi:hypothetical protein